VRSALVLDDLALVLRGDAQPLERDLDDLTRLPQIDLPGQQVGPGLLDIGQGLRPIQW